MIWINIKLNRDETFKKTEQYMWYIPSFAREFLSVLSE